MPPRAKTTVKHLHNERELDAALSGDDRSNTLAGIVDGLFSRADLAPFAPLAAGVVYAISTFAEETANDVAGLAVEKATAAVRDDLDSALKMATDNEAKAVRLQKAVDAATERETQARADCAAALRRAEAAEAEAAELRNALAPLRALLGKG